MTAVLTPPGAQTSTLGTPVPAAGLTGRRFLAGYAWTLAVPVVALTGLLAGWMLLPVAGWPAAVTAVTGWSMGMVAWLRRRGWTLARAHLVSGIAPAALIVPLAVLGLLSADGLVLWGPVSALLAVALAAVHDPRMVRLRR